jgi:hypothetical protein
MLSKFFIGFSLLRRLACRQGARGNARGAIASLVKR